MGSPCELQVYAASKHQFENIAKAVIADLIRLEKKYSRYQADSFLTEINHAANLGREMRVDEETEKLFDYATTCYEQSDGLFDITTGVLRRIWHFSAANPQPPAQQDIENLLQCVGWDKVDWQPPTLGFKMAGLELDFGGIVKEYAADRAASLSQVFGAKHGIINLGGDIKIIGPHPDGSPWRIGIRDPKDQNAISGVVFLKTGAMATSGDYERCLWFEGKRYGHILNPKTGWPVQHFASITVVSDHCVLAGSASTIGMLKESDGEAWLKQVGLPYQIIDLNGKIMTTL